MHACSNLQSMTGTTDAFLNDVRHFWFSSQPGLLCMSASSRNFQDTPILTIQTWTKSSLALYTTTVVTHFSMMCSSNRLQRDLLVPHAWDVLLVFNAHVSQFERRSWRDFVTPRIRLPLKDFYAILIIYIYIYIYIDLICLVPFLS